MFRRLFLWLRNIPIADTVDRRNAAIFQLLLLFIGVTVPYNWWRHIAEDAVADKLELFMFFDVGSALLGLGLIFAIRRGHFRPSVIIFLVSLLVSLEVGYLGLGVMIDQTSQMLALIVSGLMLGRRALWITFASLLLVFASGAIASLPSGTEVSVAFERVKLLLPAALFSYLVVTMVIDGCITALRHALEEAETRGRQLQVEMLERERTHEQLLHAQKMQATGRLASGVAHDFDNLLGLTLSFSRERHRHYEADRDPDSSAAALSEALEGVEAASRRGLALTDKLLSFARQDATHARVFDAGAAVVELKPMLRQMFDPTTRVEVAHAAEPLLILLDRDQFDLMLLNLAGNARDAMPEGGHFGLMVEPAGADHVEVTVADTGVGISESVRPYVFEPFFSTKPAGSGTGLGLSVVHQLVTSAGGSISLESTSGHGSTFRLLFPRVPQPSADSAMQDSNVVPAGFSLLRA